MTGKCFGETQVVAQLTRQRVFEPSRGYVTESAWALCQLPTTFQVKMEVTTLIFLLFTMAQVL